jgi:hypothetical protein
MTEHYIGRVPKNSELGITLMHEKPKCPECGTDLKWGETLSKFFCLNLANCSFEASLDELVKP